MGKRKGITLIALVITIIILLILAGITINLTVGQDGIITRAQQAGRNYQNAAEYEQQILAELMNTTDDMIEDTTEDKRNPYEENEFRKLIAEALTEEGVYTSEDDTDDTFVANIGKILQARTKDATATVDNITQGKTAYVNGELITGTGADNNSYYEEGRKRVKVGSCTGNGTINISSMSNYKNYTASDFYIETVSVLAEAYLAGSLRNEQDVKTTISPSLSYNSSTGVITVSRLL